MISIKTLIPQQRRGVLHRPRLVDLVQRHVDKTMTLLSAPAGYGKTSLLADFCHDAPFPVCWLSLDESDRDFHTFINSLIAALRRHFPDFGEHTRRALEANPDAGGDPAALGSVIVQDMVDHAREFFVLVLDDYHVVDMLPRLGQMLGLILKHAGGRWHVVVSSRTVPGNLPLIFLTAHDQIAYVGQNDLAFTVGEVQQVLEQTHRLTLTSEQAGELVAASEGWITGIVLATASMWRGVRDALTYARAQQGPIYAYLADQVFEGQPQALRETMLTMSTLPEMNETLCRQALGLGGAESVLQGLERHGLFLTTVVDESGARHYRYHHLFRDFLQTRLRERDPARFGRLHQQAAGHFEAQGEWVRAVAHRRAAGDARAMAQTMENGAKTLYLSGRLETLVAWYEDVPESLRPEFPRLLLFAARALFDLGRADESIPLLRQAEATFKERGETKQSLATVLQRATVRCAQGRYAETLDIVRESLKAIDFPVLIAEAHRLAGLACLNLGRPGETVEHFQTALDLHQELGRREIAVTYLDLSVAYFRLGRLGEGQTCQDKAVALLRQLGPSHYLAMTLNNIACDQYYLIGDYSRALAYLHEALDVAQVSGSPRAQAFTLLSTADLYRDLGALKEAQKLYAQAEGIARRLNHVTLINFAVLGAAQVLLQTADTVEAIGLAVQTRDQAERHKSVYQLGLSCLTLGTACLEAGDAQMALAEIERGRDQLEKGGARRDLTRAYVLLARARQAAGDAEGALEALGLALDVGIETRTFHYLVVEGQHVFDLFKLLLRQNPADRRAAQIMDRIRALPDVARQVIGGLAPTSPQRPTLRFCALGPGHVEKDNKIISSWRSTLARYLTFYLITHPPRSRDQLVAVFWPRTLSRARAKSVFHWTKHQMQNALGATLIVYEDDLYRVEWDPGYWFDMHVFESLLDRQDGDRQACLEEAISLYKGDFLQGYDAEWCLPTRERLRMRHLDALVELGELYVRNEEFDRAFTILNRAVALDDVHEPAIRALMRLHALDNRPSKALGLFCQLEQRLQEFGTHPVQSTRSLYRSIRVGGVETLLETHPGF